MPSAGLLDDPRSDGGGASGHELLTASDPQAGLDPAGPRAQTQEIAQPPPPPSGAPTIPGYTVLKALGRGGMAEVWLAEKLGTAGVPVRCVVKTILRDFSTTEGFQDRFLDEARIVAALRHANITSVLDVGRTDEAPYLAMEWCDGTDANKLIKAVRGRGVHIPLRHCMWILREALQGLHHAHTARGSDGTPLGIVHRDISPANVLIGRSGAVKIADFGVARAVLSTRPERRGTVAGKAHYFAPELFRGAPAGVSTDVFAMGVVFYELCTLQPFVDRRLSLPEVKERILSFREQEIVEGDLTLPDGIERIFLRAMAHDPAMRYASALAFLEDVNDYVYESGLRLLDAFFAEWVQRTLDGSAPEGRRPLLAGGAS